MYCGRRPNTKRRWAVSVGERQALMVGMHYGCHMCFHYTRLLTVSLDIICQNECVMDSSSSGQGIWHLMPWKRLSCGYCYRLFQNKRDSMVCTIKGCTTTERTMHAIFWYASFSFSWDSIRTVIWLLEICVWDHVICVKRWLLTAQVMLQNIA